MGSVSSVTPRSSPWSSVSGHTPVTGTRLVTGPERPPFLDRGGDLGSLGWTEPKLDSKLGPSDRLRAWERLGVQGVNSLPLPVLGPIYLGLSHDRRDRNTRPFRTPWRHTYPTWTHTDRRRDGVWWEEDIRSQCPRLLSPARGEKDGGELTKSLLQTKKQLGSRVVFRTVYHHRTFSVTTLILWLGEYRDVHEKPSLDRVSPFR